MYALLKVLFVFAVIAYFLGSRGARFFAMSLGLGRSLSDLASRLGVDPQSLSEFKPSYTERVLPKRRGGKRVLHVPSEATRELQRKVLHRVLSGLRVHPAVHGFEKGRSVVTNASPHVGKAVVLTMDILDFFGSTSAARIDWYFRFIGWNAEAAAVLTKIVTWKGGLPQGAPTSPRMSNLVNFGLDEYLDTLARKRGAVYTRYADDITMSFEKDDPRRIRGTVQVVRRILKEECYSLHGRKTRIMRRHQRQKVTGLVVNSRLNVPRKTRRRLRAVEHRLKSTGTASLRPEQLAGWKSYLDMVVRGGGKKR